VCGKIDFPQFGNPSKRRGKKVLRWDPRSKPFLTILDGKMKEHQLLEQKVKNTLAIIIILLC
jgi:hypothetical protein